MEPMSMVFVLIGFAAVVGAIVFGGSGWIYFRDQTRPLPPKPTADQDEQARARHAEEWDRAA